MTVLELELYRADKLSSDERGRLAAAGLDDLRARTSSTVFFPVVFSAVVIGLTGLVRDYPMASAAACVLQLVMAFARLWLSRSHRPAAIKASIGLSVCAVLLLSVASAIPLALYESSPYSYMAIVTMAAYSAIATNIVAIHKAYARLLIAACTVPFHVVFALGGDLVSWTFFAQAVFFHWMLRRIADQAHRAYWTAQISMAKSREGVQREAKLSRLAGKAEVAKNILHDVGNALNSLMTSIGVARDLVQDPHATGDLQALAKLLHEHSGNLGAFFEGAQGAAIPDFIAELAQRQHRSTKTLAYELTRAQRHLEHVAAIIKRQQEHARMKPVIAPTSSRTLTLEAISFVEDAYVEADVPLRMESGDDPTVWLDRHQALQVLVNLLKNALDAVRGKPGARVVVQLKWQSDGRPGVEVIDNGVGISHEQQGRIFGRGYTTKDHGHGLGLHGSLEIARAMQGDLTFRSDGRGAGTTFVFVLPWPTAPAAAA